MIDCAVQQQRMKKPDPAMNKPNIVILDMEWTAWEGSKERSWTGPGEMRETVQIGAVKLSYDDGLTEIGMFDCYIKPQFNPELSDYFIDLTGITQATVDNLGIPFEHALHKFQNFIADDTWRICSHGGDDNQILENCVLYGLSNPFEAASFCDVSQPIADYLKVERLYYCSGDLSEPFGLERPGGAHNAVTDSRCIAGALRILHHEGIDFMSPRFRSVAIS